MGKGRPLGSLVCHVFFVFCYFPTWCPESGEVLDYIASIKCMNAIEVRQGSSCCLASPKIK